MTYAEAASPERASLIAYARDAISEGSKSFRFASRLFDTQTRERAWLLYAWCRACDDLADGQTSGHDAVRHEDADRRLTYLQSQTEQALAGEEVGDLPFDCLRVVAKECAIPHRFVRDHIGGFAMDAGGWRPATEADLLGYCYRVAGAVGCMMAVLMGVSPDDEETLDRASDLGIAFQLANIARDLRDDHEMGRCYLPEQWMAELGIATDPLADREKLAQAGARLAALAQTYEASARIGARKLPFRSRWAVLSAAGIYGAIAREVQRRGARAWDERVVIGKPEKLRHVLAAYRDALGGSSVELSRDGLWSRPRPSLAL
jgi:phytoene synthase